MSQQMHYEIEKGVPKRVPIIHEAGHAHAFELIPRLIGHLPVNYAGSLRKSVLEEDLD